MAYKVMYEVYDTEEDLEKFINDPISEGMAPFSIYRIPSKNHQGFEVVVWWKMEDANEG
jgi:hypothetical protein